MAIRFRKSKKIAPGVKLNLSKKSAGISVGGKGLHYSVNSSGRKSVSAGIPGTGIYATKSIGNSKHKNINEQSVNMEEGALIGRYKINKVLYFILGILCILLSLPLMPIGIIFTFLGLVFLFLSHSCSKMVKSYNDNVNQHSK